MGIAGGRGGVGVSEKLPNKWQAKASTSPNARVCISEVLPKLQAYMVGVKAISFARRALLERDP
jgi:hypothetical protein